MKKNEFYSSIIDRMELFYRNFGAEWCIGDFTANTKKQELIKELILILEKKGIVKVVDGDKFIIIDLPSKYKNSQSK